MYDTEMIEILKEENTRLKTEIFEIRRALIFVAMELDLQGLDRKTIINPVLAICPTVCAFVGGNNE